MPATNPLLKIPFHPDFGIPVYLSDDARKSYLYQLGQRFRKIEMFLQKSDKACYGSYRKDNELAKLKEIQAHLLGVLDEYLKGSPAKSYERFSVLMEDYGLGEEIKNFQQFVLPKNSFLFRTQKQYGRINKNHDDKEGFLKAKKIADLFHPPFQRRRSVSTNRFSISGYPCLYLSASLTASYSECFPERKTEHDKKANRYTGFNCFSLKSLRPLYFINLSEENLLPDTLYFEDYSAKRTNKKDVSGILDNLGIYHLVLATHTKINYKPQYPGETYYFKAEYIIPQLLLQWVKEKGYAIDGIRYKSCTALRRFPGKKAHYNFVLPVRSEYLESGFCPQLTKLFSYSPVYSCYKLKKPDNIRKLLTGLTKLLMSQKLAAFKK
jgi:hypothetical protein